MEGVHDPCVTTGLDTLLIALYLKIDDDLAGSRRPGRPPRWTDELVTLAVAQALLGCHSGPRWLRTCYGRLGHLFPYLPKQPACNLKGDSDPGRIPRHTKPVSEGTTAMTSSQWECVDKGGYQ